MEYQTFRGSDVHEALTAVRDALGSDALIGSTRRVSNGRAGAFRAQLHRDHGGPRSQRDAGLGARRRRPPSRRVRRARRASASPSARPVPQARRPGEPRAGDRAAQGPRRRALARQEPAREGPGHAQRRRHRGHARQGSGTGLDARRTAPVAAPSAPWLRNRLADRIMVQPRLLERDHPQLIACVGPTGGRQDDGLSPSSRRRAAIDLGRAVHVISLDTFRVGAVEQWEALRGAHRHPVRRRA